MVDRNWMEALQHCSIFKSLSSDQSPGTYHILMRGDDELFVIAGAQISVLNITRWYEKYHDANVTLSSLSQYTTLVWSAKNDDNNFHIIKYQLSPKKDLLAIQTLSGSLYILKLPLVISNDTLMLHCMTEALYTATGDEEGGDTGNDEAMQQRDRHFIAHFDWHPLSSTGTHLVVLTQDSVIRIYDMATTVSEMIKKPESCFHIHGLKPIPLSGTILKAPSVALFPNPPCHFIFPLQRSEYHYQTRDSKDPWLFFTIFILMINGEIWRLCPVLPKEVHIYEDIRTALEDEKKRMLGDKAQEIWSVANDAKLYSKMVLAWIDEILVLSEPGTNSLVRTSLAQSEIVADWHPIATGPMMIVPNVDSKLLSEQHLGGCLFYKEAPDAKMSDVLIWLNESGEHFEIYHCLQRGFPLWGNFRHHKRIEKPKLFLSDVLEIKNASSYSQIMESLSESNMVLFLNANGLYQIMSHRKAFWNESIQKAPLKPVFLTKVNVPLLAAATVKHRLLGRAVLAIDAHFECRLLDIASLRFEGLSITKLAIKPLEAFRSPLVDELTQLHRCITGLDALLLNTKTWRLKKETLETDENYLKRVVALLKEKAVNELNTFQRLIQHQAELSQVESQALLYKVNQLKQSLEKHLTSEDRNHIRIATLGENYDRIKEKYNRLYKTVSALLAGPLSSQEKKYSEELRTIMESLDQFKLKHHKIQDNFIKVFVEQRYRIQQYSKEVLQPFFDDLCLQEEGMTKVRKDFLRLEKVLHDITHHQDYLHSV